ncbi:Uncharacterised protein [Mycoplasmoides gallisepticum]|uniref:Uncharacterized protein n=1 Tax=Mycoplasmoides gallisepticum TaxID=2096 RepID=A0A3B0PS80_MYCGL|nr:Uncharacterised protein [Mycoplasmoides gallisepticum]
MCNCLGLNTHSGIPIVLSQALNFKKVEAREFLLANLYNCSILGAKPNQLNFSYLFLSLFQATE